MIKPLYSYINGLMTKSIDFSNLIDEIPVGILILDCDRRVVYLNRAFEALSGFSIAMAYGIKCCNVLRSAACITRCPVLYINSNNSNTLSCESDMINLDRQRLPIHITTAKIIDNEGNTTGFIETIEDIRASQSFEQKKNAAYSFANIIGRSPQMEKIFQILPVLAQSDVSVLITGETGTGKDLAAEAIHQTSSRASGPFIKINCGAFPETLLESEIFGHQKGAFTGAIENKQGRFKLAHNGTIFLTEIGDLPLPLQVKLLTFLDDKIIYPLGGTKGFTADVRIIAATNRHLEEMVKEKSFRRDLFFRLNVARIHMPPLRNREGDIRLLLDYFFNSYKKLQNKNVTGFSKTAMQFLINYYYEGNIRELKNIVEYSVNITTGGKIEKENLPSYLFDAVSISKQVPIEVKNHSIKNHDLWTTDVSDKNIKKVPETWASVQRQMIIDTLKKTNGKKSEAARLLGWGRSTLWRKIKQYGID